MSVSAARAAARLGVDAYGLARLMALGDLPAEPDAAALDALHHHRMQRRADALEALAALDGTWLAPNGGVDAPPIPMPAPDPLAVDANTPAVFIDACVLAGAMRRHLVLALAEAGLIIPRWSPKVLMETGHAHARMVDGKADRDGPGEAAQLVTVLEAAFPEASVPEDQAEAITITGKLPDPGDAHVMKSAAAGRCRLILTENMRDFPRATLKPLGLYARPTHELAASLQGREPAATRTAILTAASRLKLSPPRLLQALQTARLGGVAKRLAL